MRDDHTEEQAALYVMDLLTGAEKLEFERQLGSSEELRALVRELSAGLYAPLKDIGPAPARPDLLAGVRARIHAGRGAGRPEVPVPARRIPWAAVWAMAAVVLLGFNLFLLSGIERAAGPGTGALAQDGASGGPAGTAAAAVAAALDGNAPAEVVLRAEMVRLEQELQTTAAALQASRQSLAAITAENSEIKAYNSGWQREYSRLVARIAPFFAANKGISRFTVIEMVDAGTFENAGPRRGFADLAGQFLTGEGNIAGVSQGLFVGPVVEGAGLATLSAEPIGPGLLPVARGEAMPLAGQASAGEDPAAVPVAPDGLAQPVGFTVWRDDEQKGFLDLYDLPVPEAGRQAFLWVRSSELEPFLPVGFLPELEYGRGSLFYSVDEPNFTPSEVLITAEEPDATGATPVGPVLLRGP